MRYCTVALALFLALAGALEGQQYSFHLYDQSDGLINLQTHSMAFDHDGFLWVATLNGIFRFLGSRFEHFGPAQGVKERQILQMWVDGEGRVWASSSKNLYLSQSRRFQVAQIGAIPFGPIDDLVSVGNNRLIVVKGGILIEVTLRRDGTLVSAKPVFSASQRTASPELSHVEGIARAKDGTIWMGCGTATCSFHEGEVKRWVHRASVTVQSSRKLYVDQQGGVWDRTGNRVLYLPPDASAFQDRSPPGMAQPRFFQWASILEDRVGRILLNTAAGLQRWEAGSWKTIGPANGLNTTGATSLAKDPNGDVWIGTVQGVWHWTGYEHWESWTQAQGLPSPGIWSIRPTEDGNVLIGTIKGPAILNPGNGRVTSLARDKPWPWAQVSGIGKDDRGSVWMATFAGSVLKSDAEFSAIRRVADLASFTGRLRMDRDGVGWIAGVKGVYSIDTTAPVTTVKQDTEANALIGKEVNAISISSAAPNADIGDLWISTRHHLIVRRAGGWETPVISGLALEKISIQEVSANRGTLFICGDDERNRIAVWRLDRSSNGSMAASSVQLPPQFDGLLAMSILADHRGWLWLGTDNGLAAWNGAQWRMFNRESGLIWDDLNRNVLREGIDGSIWIGTPAGVGHIMRADTIFAPVALPLKVLGAQVNGRNADPTNIATLPWARNQLRFQFSSPGMWNRSALSFNYRILGLDPAWVATQNTDAAFSDLPPGHYRFQVFAENVATGSRSAVVEAAFGIFPPWWRTVWFYIACAIAGALLIWLLLRLRTKQLQTKKRDLERTVQQMWAETHRLAERAQDATLAEERNRLAHELHDSLAAAFTAIYIQLQAATDLAANGDNRSLACVARAEELSRSGLQHVREFAQSLIARSDRPPPGVSALREIVTFVTAGTTVSGSFDVQGRERLLKPECALALARILQEAIGNAQRYAACTMISVTLRFEDRAVSLAIQDNGKGFLTEKLNGAGFGLAGIRARAVRLSGTFDLLSSPGNGTRIVVEVPDPYTDYPSGST